MNTGKKLRTTQIDLRRCARVTAHLLLISFGAATASHAASFRCPRNASPSERLVCSDPELSALDDQLAAVFREAHDAAPDASALDADRLTQWRWRQRNCKERSCVADWYARRISELQADVAQGKKETAGNIKSRITEQKLAPSAEAAVLGLKGLAAAKHQQADAVSKVSVDTENGAPLTLRTASVLGGQADAERFRIAPATRYETAAAAPLQNLTTAPRRVPVGAGPTPCNGECAQRQVHLAF